MYQLALMDIKQHLLLMFMPIVKSELIEMT